MKTFRRVFAILVLIPLTLLVDSIFLHPSNYGPGSLGELAYLVLGVPILTLNFWAWEYPEIIEFYFLRQGIQTQSLIQSDAINHFEEGEVE